MGRARGGQVWRDWLTVYGATLVAQVVQGVRSLAVAGLLGPQQFGLWKSLQLILFYSSWTDLGARRAVGRQIPFLRGAGQASASMGAQQAAWLLTLVPTILVALVLLFANHFTDDTTLARGLMVFAPVLLTTRVLIYLFEIANAEKAFSVRARGMVWLALLDGALAPLASWWGDVWLFMWSVTLVNTVISVYLARGLSFSARLAWSVPDLRQTMAIGLPITASAFAFDLIRTVDRSVIVALLGTEAVGYYGLAMVLFEVTSAVPFLFGQVLLPHLVERFGKDGDSDAVFRAAEDVIRIVSAILPVFLLVGWLLLPTATVWVLPAYVPGVDAARVLLCATVFLTVHAIASVVLVALRHLGVLVVLNGAGIVIGGGLSLAAAHAGFGITGVATAMLLTYWLIAAGSFLLAGTACRRSWLKLIGTYAWIHVPMAAAAGAGLLLEQVTLTRGLPTMLALLGAVGVPLNVVMAWLMCRAAVKAEASKPTDKARVFGPAGTLVADDLVAPYVVGPQADVEEADWRFLVPFDRESRVLWLGSRRPQSLTLTTPYRVLVLDNPAASTDAARGRVNARIKIRSDHLPFRSGSFNIVTVDLPLERWDGESLPDCLAEIRRILVPGGVLHLAVAGWSVQAGLSLADWRRWLPVPFEVFRARSRLRLLLRALEQRGFDCVRCYARLPSHVVPRYLFSCDDARSLEFLLSRFPTSAQPNAGMLPRLFRVGFWVLRRFQISLAPVMPGVSVVARGARS
ncbi:MAG: methyltransferase domain-containing protein [Candidatus Binatia bacterium]